MSQISQASASYQETSMLDTKIVGEYKIGTEIGRGSFANVYKGVNLVSFSSDSISIVVNILTTSIENTFSCCYQINIKNKIKK